MWPSRLPALSFLLLIVLGCRPDPPGPATIEEILHAAVAIDMNSAKLHEDGRDFDLPSGGGIILVRFRAGMKLVKVSARQYGGGGQTHHAYYLHNGLPFLVIYRFYWFADPNSDRVVHTLTDSLYYAEGALLRSVSVDSPMWVQSRHRVLRPSTRSPTGFTSSWR